MAIFTHALQQIGHILHPQERQQPPDLEAGVQDHVTDWANLMITFVLAFAPPLFRILIKLCHLLREQIHEAQVPCASPLARCCWYLLCSDRFLHSYYDTISSVPPNYHLGGLCHFRSCDFSFHFLPSRILVFGAISLGWSMPFQLTRDSLVDSDLVF
jgi:hypothetical protein